MEFGATGLGQDSGRRARRGALPLRSLIQASPAVAQSVDDVLFYQAFRNPGPGRDFGMGQPGHPAECKDLPIQRRKLIQGRFEDHHLIAVDRRHRLFRTVVRFVSKQDLDAARP